MIQRLHKTYETSVRQTLSEQFQYTNTHEVPALTKIVINESCAPNFKFFNEKKIWNDSDDF